MMFGSCLEDSLPPVIVDIVQMVNYVTNPIQFRGGGTKTFYIYAMKKYNKKFLCLFCA